MNLPSTGLARATGQAPAADGNGRNSDMKSTIALKRAVGTALAAGLLSSAAALPAFAIDVTQDQLLNADKTPENWLLPLGDYSAHRYSSLNEINRDNVANLKAAFTVPIPTGLVGTVNAGL